jgi:hypothetical protein
MSKRSFHAFSTLMKPMNEKRPEAVFRNGMAARISVAEQLPRRGIAQLGSGSNYMEIRMLLWAMKQGWPIEKAPRVP